MFRMKAKNAGAFGLVTFIGNIDWSINVPGKNIKVMQSRVLVNLFVYVFVYICLKPWLF